MTRSARILVTAVLAAALLPASSAVALTYQWSWSDPYTDVRAANRTFVHRTASEQASGRGAHELSARRNRDDNSKGRATAAVKTRFQPVSADQIRAWSSGRVSERTLEQLARLKVYVHCLDEVEDPESDWVLIGSTDVAPTTASSELSRPVTTEDCPSQTVDGVMFQVVTGERGDRKRRTVFLERAELGPVNAATWTEDFTTS